MTMTAQTISKIRFIAECAHEDCALTTLKNAKEQITNRCKIFAGYESQWEGVDRAEVLECFTQAMDCNRKADFARRIELLLETLINIEIENERAAIRAAREAAAAPAPAVTADEFARDVVRIANRDFALWATRSQVDAVLADGNEYTAEQVARIIYNEAQAMAERERLAGELATAQTEYTAAANASMTALDVAVMADPTGTGDTPEFEAYNAAEEAQTVATEKLLQACGRYSVAIAQHVGKPVSDIEALKNCFAPFFSGNTGNVHPGRVNDLVSKALEIPVSAPQIH